MQKIMIKNQAELKSELNSLSKYIGDACKEMSLSIRIKKYPKLFMRRLTAK